MDIPVPEKKVFLLHREHSRLLQAIDAMTKKGRRINVLVSGDQGSGKSELVIQFAAHRNRPLATIEVGRLGDPSQLFGYMALKDGQTSYVKGLFTEAVTTPGCVIHLQEINRSENDKALNTLFSILDDTNRAIWIDELSDYVTVAPGVVIFATMNEGFEFIGTQPLDPALANRFHIKITMHYLPPDFERTVVMTRTGLDFELSNTLVQMAVRLRTNDQHPIRVSTRDLIAIGDLVATGVPFLLAVKAAIGTDLDTLESILLQDHLGDGQPAGKGENLDGYETLYYSENGYQKIQKVTVQPTTKPSPTQSTVPLMTSSPPSSPNHEDLQHLIQSLKPSR